MIIININGGLGNQLFQYAFGRSLALRLNTELFLYTEKLKLNWLRSYNLHHFRIPCKTISKRKIKSYLDKNAIEVINEDKSVQNSENLIFQNNAFYIGSWQSRYFFETDFIKFRDEMDIITPPSFLDQHFLDQINTSNSICIHIRKGDYITRKSTFKKYGSICTLEYYQNAMKYILENTNNPHFFVFSDDIQWAKENIVTVAPISFVSHNYSRWHSSLERFYIYRLFLLIVKLRKKDLAIQDLRLMLNCKHFIISNSTFGWWAAWLSINKEKIVIAPHKWHNSNENLTFDHLIPDSWVRF